MILSEKEIIERKIARVETIVEQEIVEIVRLELLVKNEDVAVKELPENAAREKALEDYTTRLEMYNRQIKEVYKSIENAELLLQDYKEQLKKHE